MPKFFRTTLTLNILLTAASIFCLYQFVLPNLDFFKIIHLKYQDIFTQIAYNFKKTDPEIKNIVIIKMDDESIRMINRKLPWPRSLISEVLAKINSYQPKVLALDFLLLGQSSEPGDDLLLAKEFTKGRNIILGSYFDEKGSYALPNAIFRDKVSAWGFVNRPRDVDLTVRATRPIRTYGSNRMIDYSLSLKTAALYLDCPLSEIKFSGREITLPSKSKGLIKIEVGKNGAVPVNYSANLSKFQNISFWRVLKTDLPPGFFKDKIVLIGATSEVFHDIYPSPIGLMPGVVFLANDILTVISNNFIKYFPERLGIFILFLICCLSSYFAYRFHIYRGLVLSSILVLIFFFGALVLAFKNYSGDFFGPIFIVVSTFSIANSYKYFSLIMESAHLKALAITDGLTGLYVYRYFALVLQNEFTKAAKAGKNLSLVIMDIDHFKNLNDTYGHEQGNVILKTLAGLLQQSCRKSDILCRYGGEEFVVILRDTNQREAVSFAEKIRRIVDNYNFPGPSETLKITLSFGACGLQESKVQNAEDLIKCADAALYQAKREGRDRVCFFSKE